MALEIDIRGPDLAYACHVHTVSLGIGENITTVGIDIQAPSPTPFGEFIRININPIGELTAISHDLEAAFSLLQPILVCAWQSLAVGKNRPGSIKILFGIPNQAGYLNLFRRFLRIVCGHNF